MTIDLITNSCDKKVTHAQEVCAGIASAKQILICTAFLKTTGLKIIRDSLQAALKNGATVKAIVGLDFYTTEPEALLDLYEIMGSNKDKNNAWLKICLQGNETFHPKLYYWRVDENVNMIIGSANITGGGLAKNIELSIAGKFSSDSAFVKKVEEFFIETFEASVDNRINNRIKTADSILISKYSHEWKIHSKARKKAELEANETIAKEIKIDFAKLLNYVKAYRLSRAERNSWKLKCQKYEQARKLLDSLIDQRPTKEKFRREYERLIEGDEHLWSSGSLFRHKNMVIGNHLKFLKVLRIIKTEFETVAVERLLTEIRGEDVKGLGWNGITEILNTFAPSKFGVFNGNSTGSLRHLGLDVAKEPSNSNVQAYLHFNFVVLELAKKCGFKNLAQVDHFLNYVYQNHAKKEKVT